MEAAKQLDIDLNLGLCDIKLSGVQKKEYALKKAKREREKRLAAEFRQWEQRYYDYVVSNLKLLEQLADVSEPRYKGGKFTDDYAYAVNRAQMLEYHWDILFNGSLEDKIDLYRQVNKAVKN